MACYVSTKEENYFKIAKIVLNVIPENLREKFKVRWKDVYGSEWMDDQTSGSAFSAKLYRSGGKYQYIQTKVQIEAGKTTLWDCTTLFFAFRSLKLFENADEKFYIDTKLRKTRNEIAHAPKNELSKVDYDHLLSEIETTFGNLDWQDGLEAIREIDESKLENDHFQELEQQLIAERKKMEDISETIDDHEQRISALENDKRHSQSEKIFKVPSIVENFVGRVEVIEQLKAEVEKHSFVVLHGFACHGKTAVATKLAHELKGNYDNVVMADVRPMIEFEKMCAGILGKLNCDISSAANDKVRCLETKLRQLKNNQTKTLLILDNIEKVIPPNNETKSEAYEMNSIKQLMDMVSDNCAGCFKIFGVSRYPVAQSVFPDSVNVLIEHLDEEQSREFLKIALPSKKHVHVDLLVEKCRGVPFFLDVISKMLLEEIGDDRYLLERIKKFPLSAVSDNIKALLKVILESISSEELQLIKILCVFPSSFGRYFADKLCRQLGVQEIPFESLEAKGMLTKSSGLGHSLHPFLRDSVMEESDILMYEEALTSVYIEYIFDISERSFEKDKSPDCVAEFNEKIHAYDHLMTLINKTFTEGRISIGEEALFVRSTLERDDDTSFILLMRFLYYQVPKKEIQVLFNYFKKQTDDVHHSTLNACIDETIADFTERKDKSLMRRYEDMMFDMRKLYDQLDTRKTPTNTMAGDTLETFVQALENKINVLENQSTSQQHRKVMAYYQLKFWKLAGKFYGIKKRNRERQLQLLEKSLEISLKNFGDSFLTIDCHERIAKQMEVEKEYEMAEVHFREAYKIAERSRLLGQKKMVNLYTTMGKFLSNTNEQQKQAEGLGLLVTSFKYDLAQMVHDNEDTVVEMFDRLFDIIIKMHTFIYDEDEIKKKMDECIRKFREFYFDCEHSKEKTISEKQPGLCYKWHKMLATRTAHVVLEQERKAYAVEALRIKEKYPYVENKQDPYFLDLIIASTRGPAKQEILRDISFLENVNETIMKSGKSQEIQAHIEKILSLLKQSSEEDSSLKDGESLIEDWMRVKLIDCLLTLDSKWPEKLLKPLEPKDALGYFKEIVEFVEDKQSRRGQRLSTERPYHVTITMLERNPNLLKDEQYSSEFRELCQRIRAVLEEVGCQDKRKQGPLKKKFQKFLEEQREGKSKAINRRRRKKKESVG